MSAIPDIGNRIQERRKALGITRGELAERVGTSQHNLRRVEKGGDTSVSTLALICRELNVSADWLMFGKSALARLVDVADSPLSPRSARLLMDIAVGLSEVESLARKGAAPR